MERKRIHFWKAGENCSVLMSCESKPEVISTPMQQKKRQMYMRRRFLFLYHGTLSSWAKRVTIGSATEPMFTATIVADETEKIWGSNLRDNRSINRFKALVEYNKEVEQADRFARCSPGPATLLTNVFSPTTKTCSAVPHFLHLPHVPRSLRQTSDS